MIRLYIFLIAITLTSFSFGQLVQQKTTPFKFKAPEKISKSLELAPQDKGATLWSNDFTTPGDWTTTAIVAPDNWVIGTGVPSGGFAIGGLTSTSGGNFALFDSDLMCSGTQDATLTINTPINLSANANVSLQFEQYYRKFNCTTYIGVSTNGGTTWTDIEVNANIGSGDFNDLDINSNPNLQTVNISAQAGNQAAVLIRFHFVGGCCYAWMVDDVKIVEMDNNDMVASKGFYGFGPSLIQYTRVPITQITSANFSIKTANVGAVNQTNTILTADVNGGFLGTSTPITNNVGATDSLVTTTQYTPPATLGVPLNITLTVASDSTDASPTNNTVTFPPIEITPVFFGIYAHDDYSATPGNGGGYNNTPIPATEDFEAGNYFDIISNQTLGGINISIGSNTQVGAIFDLVLYEVDSMGNFIQVDRSNIYVVTAADLGNIVGLYLPTFPMLTAGTTYFAAVHGWGGTTFEFFYGTSGTSVDNFAPSGATSLLFYPNMTNPYTGQAFYTTQTPMVRLDFSYSGIEDIDADKVNFTVYPNPSAGMFTVNLNASISGEVNLSVKNIIGQTIVNRTISVSGKTQETISLNDYSKGIYFLTINNRTVKLTVK